ncbi:MAG: PQQ-like beta-propeller repeat protein, partial [Bacteroidales bacterium]|nr:PQQ-like beta-propeller repeat protein [Bacteroidales bacterium]
MKQLSILILLSAALISCTQEQAKLYEWRGYDRNGIYPDKNLLEEWPTEGPELLWSIDDLGNGFSAPVFAGNHFFLTAEVDTMAILYCYDLKGKKVWQTTLGREWMKSYPGGRDTPTVVDDLLYIGTGLGDLFCVNRHSGEIVWSKRLKEDFNGLLPLHGYSEAPLTDGDLVFWTPGGKEHNVVALNRFTGELVWSNPGFGEAMGYHSARLVRFPERNIMVTFSSWHLMGFDTSTGELLWWHEQDNLKPEERKPGYGDTHTSTILYEDGAIYYQAGDGNGGVKLSLSEDGRSITELWRNPKFDGYMGGIVKLGDYIFGTGTSRPELRSINAITGEFADSLRLGAGTVISADGLLYYYSQKGEISLVRQENGKMEQI